MVEFVATYSSLLIGGTGLGTTGFTGTTTGTTTGITTGTIAGTTTGTHGTGTTLRG